MYVCIYIYIYQVTSHTEICMSGWQHNKYNKEESSSLHRHVFKWAYAQTAALEGCLTLAPGSEAAVWDN